MTCLIWNNEKSLNNADLVTKLFANEPVELSGSSAVWSVKNKYYSSDVTLCITSSGDFQAEEDKVGASILYSQTIEENEVEEVLNNWANRHISQPSDSKDSVDDEESDFFSSIDVQLIVVDCFASPEAKHLANKWSIEHGVEIIDYSEDQDESCDDVHIFASNGQKRVVEALQTVMWPQLCDEPAAETNDGEPTVGDDLADFETLFANMVAFKESAASLPDEERRKFAEKVALSFYAALGGSSDEES